MHAARLGNTWFTLSTELRVAGEELRKTPLPADLRAALERGAPGVVTDHAGYL